MAEKVPENVRAAQRRIVGTVLSSGVLTGGGLALWREDQAEEFRLGASAEEISADLQLLEVPNRIVTAFRFPLANARGNAMRRGREVRVLRNDLTHLVRWMPALKEGIDQLTDAAPPFEFTAFEPRKEGMAILTLALAADWPRWTRAQAERSRLLCAECGHDLRQQDDYAPAPFNLPTIDKPKKYRLVCGNCCNNGLDALRALAAA